MLCNSLTPLGGLRNLLDFVHHRTEQRLAAAFAANTQPIARLEKKGEK